MCVDMCVCACVDERVCVLIQTYIYTYIYIPMPLNTFVCAVSQAPLQAASSWLSLLSDPTNVVVAGTPPSLSQVEDALVSKISLGLFFYVIFIVITPGVCCYVTRATSTDKCAYEPMMQCYRQCLDVIFKIQSCTFNGRLSHPYFVFLL